MATQPRNPNTTIDQTPAGSPDKLPNGMPRNPEHAADAQEAAKNAKAPDGAVKVDLHNPTPGTRVIHDGIQGSQKQITIAPGETKRHVIISKATADELKARTHPRGKEKSDLTVHPAGQGPDASGVAPAAKSDEDPDTED